MTLVAECVRFSKVDPGLNGTVGWETSSGSRNVKVDHCAPPRHACLDVVDGSRFGEKHIDGRPQYSSRPQDSPKYQLWPSLKLPGSMPRVTTPEPETRLTRIPARSSSLRHDRHAQHSPHGPLRSNLHGGTIPSRRNRSIPALALAAALTTVQEATMDSPTIPDRLQHHERSQSAPGVCSRHPSFEGPTGLPVLAPLTQVQEEPRARVKDQHREITGKDPSVGTPSRWVAQGLGPSMRPKNSSTSINGRACENSDDVPPAVPPKSPRTAGRATPVFRGPPSVRNNSHVAVQTGIVSELSADQRDPSELWRNPQGLLSDQYEVATTGGRSSPNSAAVPSRGDVASERRRGQISQGHSTSVELDATPACVPSPLRGNKSSVQTSIIARARPTKRVEGIVKRNLSKSVRTHSSQDQKTMLDLPRGTCTTEASCKLTGSERKSLRNQAIAQAERYEVLQRGDVEALSKELHTLDERCAYLRNTHNSLREGRRGLQTRTIGYLRFPMTARISQESMLKQEKALAELDAAIDDWASKLEQADNRRNLIRQKLLEHFAAALLLQTECSQSRRNTHLETPPDSPERLQNPEWAERKDVESIKIYADSDMYALLASIEQEICVIGNADVPVKSGLDCGEAAIQPVPPLVTGRY